MKTVRFLGVVANPQVGRVLLNKVDKSALHSFIWSDTQDYVLEKRLVTGVMNAWNLSRVALVPSVEAWDLSHAQPQRASSDVQFCEEGAFEGLAVQMDFVFACYVLWLRVCRVYPYLAIGDAFALAIRDAPITKDINVGPLPLSEINASIASKCARWKTRWRKQNEFSWGRGTINFG